MYQDPIATPQTDLDQRTDIHLRSFDLFNNLLLNREAVYQAFQETSPTGISLVRGQNSDKSERVESGHQYIDPIDVIKQDEGMSPKKPFIQLDGVRTASKRKTGTEPGKGTSKLSIKIKRRSKNSTPRSSPRPSPSRAPQASAHMASAANDPKVSGDDQDVITKAKGPTKTTAAHAESKTTLKRPAPTVTIIERPFKVSKPTPKANSSKRVNGRGDCLEDAFVISDDDTHNPGKPVPLRRTVSLTPPLQSTVKVSSPSPVREDDLQPNSFLPPVQPSFRPFLSRGYLASSILNPLPDLKHHHMPTPKTTCELTSNTELARIKDAHAKELADHPHQIDAFAAEIRKTKDEAEQAAIEHKRQSASSSEQIATLTKELESERGKSENLTGECERLRGRDRDSQNSKMELKKRVDDLERLYKEEQTRTKSLERDKSDQQDLSTRKERDLTTQLDQLTTELDLLKQEVTQLQRDNAALKATTPFQPSLSPLSLLSISPSVRRTRTPFTTPWSECLTPVKSPPPSSFLTPTPTLPLLSPPSTSSSTFPSSRTPSQPPSSPPPPSHPTDHRLTNMRRTYIALKRKHDMLSSAATNLATLTRGWDHAAFGEFGRGLRQLAVVLGEEAGAMGTVGAVEVAGGERAEKDGKGG